MPFEYKPIPRSKSWHEMSQKEQHAANEQSLNEYSRQWREWRSSCKYRIIRFQSGNAEEWHFVTWREAKSEFIRQISWGWIYWACRIELDRINCAKPKTICSVYHSPDNTPKIIKTYWKEKDAIELIGGCVVYP